MQTFQGGNICAVMFAGSTGEKPFFVDFTMDRLAITPARFVVLKAGEQFHEAIPVPFDGQPGAGFVNLPRPAAKQPVILKAGVCAKVDTKGKPSWDAADTRRSGAITIELK